jgi:hypothetical protein
MIPATSNPPKRPNRQASSGQSNLRLRFLLYLIGLLQKLPGFRGLRSLLCLIETAAAGGEGWSRSTLSLALKALLSRCRQALWQGRSAFPGIVTSPWSSLIEDERQTSDPLPSGFETKLLHALRDSPGSVWIANDQVTPLGLNQR